MGNSRGCVIQILGLRLVANGISTYHLLTRSSQNYIPRDIERAQWRWATASNWLWNSLIGFFTPFITQEIDFAYGYVFAGCLFVAVLTVYFFVIEGKDKTLEEMDMMYVMRVKPWESRKWTPPAPEHQVTTAQLSDERVAEDYGGEEETAINTKEAGPASA